MSQKSALDQLDAFIDAQSPQLATFLQHKWNQQQNAITYKELREAIFSGQLSMTYLTQWQQDYSAFIVQSYAPLAEQAIKQAANNLLGKYAGGLLDPQIDTMNTFIQTHGGKLIREISQTQFSAINTLVRQAALSEGTTVDQLARAIRPCIGLTQRQAQATKNYYDSLIDQGYSQKDALKKQAIYSERMHRQRAATIAQTEMAFAYNAGAQAVIQQNIDNGYFAPGVKKRWMTSADELVCKECGKLDGMTVDFDAPFPGISNASTDHKLPPAHPNCRCTIAYDNITVLKPAITQPSQAARQPTTNTPDPTYQQPEIPDKLTHTAQDFDYKGSAALGTGEMHQYTDAATGTDEWLFKPAQTKSGKPEAFRAYVQEAGYRVQGIVDPDTAVPCQTITIDTHTKGTKFGAIQLKQTDLDSSFDLKAWQNGTGVAPSREVIAQLQKENVTDWLMCNYDSHGGNFIQNATTGKVIGVDKEQAFRYISNPNAQKMSYTFHPNQNYGETEPIYNTLYRKFAHGEIDFDLNDTLAYIKRIEAVPDAEYREIFRDCAESLLGKGNKAEQLLDSIVARKKTLRTTFEDFYTDILTERKGTATTFQFLDSVTAAAAKPIASATMSATTLKGMALGDLKTIAQQQGIKYAWNMNKGQLVDAISDPAKTAQIVADAKARAYGIGTTPRVPKPTPASVVTPATGGKPKIDGITQLGEAMDDFDVALDNTTYRGVSLISDKSALEGMQTTLRKITVDGKDAYELSGKLTNTRWIQANNDIAGNTSGNWQFQKTTGQIDYTKPALDFTSSGAQRYSIPTQYIRNGDDILVLTGKDCANDARAMMGEFNIRVFATNGKDAAQKVQDLLSQAKLMDVVDDVEPAALERYKKMRLIWQRDPKLAASLDPATSSESQISNALKKLGITQQQVDKMRLLKVTDGYFTFVDDTVEQITKAKGVAYLWSGVSDVDSAASIIETGELASSTQRLKRGIFGSGASVSRDIEVGGADNVFSRIAMQNNVGVERFDDSFASGKYQFIFDKRVLNRTDWYAYTGDNFGTTQARTFNSRNGLSDHFDALNRSYHSSNEVMMRKSISLGDLTTIRCRDTTAKRMLIDQLHSKGITHINGKKIEDIIKAGGGKL